MPCLLMKVLVNTAACCCQQAGLFFTKIGAAINAAVSAKSLWPYAIGVEKVLYAMNGVYLKGLKQQQEAKPFDPLHLNYEKWYEVKEYEDKQLNAAEASRLNNPVQLITMVFTSELSL